jgi:ABC-type transporter Mla MlaB component
MSLFEENESLLDTLEEAEARVEKIKIDGVDSVDDETRKQLALEIKTIIRRLVDNVAASSDDVEALGGALVLVDLMEVLKRYTEVFDIDGIAEQLANLEKMWEDSK